jgi:hypothetical protein
MIVRFDDSLPIIARIVCDELGAKALASGVVLRDATGRLAFFSDAELSTEASEQLSRRLRHELQAYARSDRIVACRGEFGVSDILSDPTILKVTANDCDLRLVDRRLVGADWLRAPACAAKPPQRYVFASLKGGVGRSTALSVAAAHFASHGRRVLAIDLDMEAPGLGAMLLDPAGLPEFGVIDALVENGLSPLDDTFLADLVSPSSLTNRGKIDVMPAFGARSIRNPKEILAKIARAYTENVRSDGTVASILDQVSELVDRFADPTRYDAIMIDARAGLHETTAASVLGLGAEVFLFGLNEPQTFQGYAAMLSHLSRFLNASSPLPEWVERITMVQGRAPDSASHSEFVEKCRSLFAEVGLVSRSGIAGNIVRLPAEPFNNVPWDEEVSDEDLGLDDSPGGREPIAILDDERFRLFNPGGKRDLLSEAVYRASFGVFLDRISESWSDHAGGGH